MPLKGLTPGTFASFPSPKATSNIGGSGSNIKSLQSGTATYTNTTSMDVTIAPVDTTKSVVRISYGASSTTADYGSYTVKIINSTTIRIQTYLANVTGRAVEWEVAEYNNVKSNQSGTVVGTGVETTFSVTVSSVATNKSQLIVTARGNTNSNVYYYYFQDYKITNSTTLTFTPGIALGAGSTAEWQLIEFY